MRSDAARRLTGGASSPLGVAPKREGTSFSLFSRHASRVELLLCDQPDDATLARAIRLDPVANRTYHYWYRHALVPGVTVARSTAIASRGPGIPRAPCGSIPSRSSSTLTAVPCRGRPRHLQSRVYPLRRRQRRDRDAERGGGSVRLRLGRRHTTAAASRADHHLRTRGTFAGLIRRSLSPAARDHRGGAAAASCRGVA